MPYFFDILSHAPKQKICFVVVAFFSNRGTPTSECHGLKRMLLQQNKMPIVSATHYFDRPGHDFSCSTELKSVFQEYDHSPGEGEQLLFGAVRPFSYDELLVFHPPRQNMPSLKAFSKNSSFFGWQCEYVEQS